MRAAFFFIICSLLSASSNFETPVVELLGEPTGADDLLLPLLGGVVGRLRAFDDVAERNKFWK